MSKIYLSFGYPEDYSSSEIIDIEKELTVDITSSEITEDNLNNAILKSVNNRSDFKDTFALIGIKIEDGITSIGKDAFLEDYALQTIVLPSTLKIIKDGAFAECVYIIESLHIPSGVQELGAEIFNGSNIENLIFDGDAPEKIDINTLKGANIKNIWIRKDSVGWDKTNIKDQIKIIKCKLHLV